MRLNALASTSWGQKETPHSRLGLEGSVSRSLARVSVVILLFTFLIAFL